MGAEHPVVEEPNLLEVEVSDDEWGSLWEEVLQEDARARETEQPALKREDRLGKDPFAGFGTVVEDITESGYTKNQPILLGPF